FALGERGKPAEAVADEAVEQVIRYLHADEALVDAHSADQLLLPLALADGPSEYRAAEVTLHLTTNLDVIRLFLDRDIACEGEEVTPGVVRIAWRSFHFSGRRPIMEGACPGCPSMPVPLEEVCCAHFPAAALALLGELRTRDDVRVLTDGDRVWVYWPA